MTQDDMLIAYADGELGPIEARRIERAIAADPALARRLAAHRALQARVAAAFAPVAAEPVPDRLAALIGTNVVALPERPARRLVAWWPAGLAAAAALALTVGLGQWRAAPSGQDDADAVLAAALDRQPSSRNGDPRILLSFRNAAGGYCRLYERRADAGIACRETAGWQIVRRGGGVQRNRSDYRQAGVGDPALLARAQDMMVGDPLDAAGEAAARQHGWRRR